MQAAIIDERLARGEQVGPLAGVPIAIKASPKLLLLLLHFAARLPCPFSRRHPVTAARPPCAQDNICTRGLRTTAGSQQLSRYLPPYDATAVQRLRAAGAVIVGKTNMDEFGMGSTTENSAYEVGGAGEGMPYGVWFFCMHAWGHAAGRREGRQRLGPSVPPRCWPSRARAEARLLVGSVLACGYRACGRAAGCLTRQRPAAAAAGDTESLGYRPSAGRLLGRLCGRGGSQPVRGGTRQRHRCANRTCSTPAARRRQLTGGGARTPPRPAGGSIRQPAHFCGVVGLKPTYGRVSRHGLVAYASSLDAIGPLTQTVADAAELLSVIAGAPLGGPRWAGGPCRPAALGKACLF